MDHPHRHSSARIAALTALLERVMPSHYLRNVALLGDVARRWCERQRFWHGPAHLEDMIAPLEQLTAGEDRDILLLTALYHDAVYDPRAADNEEASAALLRTHAADPHDSVITRAAELILFSKWDRLPSTSLEQQFFALDTRQLSNDVPINERLAYERAIFREYQWANWATYREKRRAILQSWAPLHPEHRRGIDECLALLESLQPRIAVYPGSFAPFHQGHLSILRQAESIFDKVIVAVGVNRRKSGAVETSHQRFAELQAQLRFHEVASFDGLLTSFVGELPLPATIVRGVRDGTDLEAELRFTRFLNELRPQTGVVWISCEAELQHLSSSAIRELEAIEPGAGQRYVPTTLAVYEMTDTSFPGTAS